MLLAQYENGNALISLYDDGTREISCEGNLKLNFPFNVDVRISERCAFGLNQSTNKAVCSFCHESATTNGRDANIEDLISVLSPLPPGVEIAVGINSFDSVAEEFLAKSKEHGWIVNATINQGLINRYKSKVLHAIEAGQLYGLGISFRPGMKLPDEELIHYKNTVFHVIAGIDSVDNVLNLKNYGIQKVLVLGEKDFGFNSGRVDLKSESHFWWYRRIHELFGSFKIVSFDNLALEQLNVRRFVKDWDTVYQHEYSLYINAVGRYFSPSSRDSRKVSWDEKDILSFFKEIKS
jgi:hypothetical protein